MLVVRHLPSFSCFSPTRDSSPLGWCCLHSAWPTHLSRNTLLNMFTAVFPGWLQIQSGQGEDQSSQAGNRRGGRKKKGEGRGGEGWEKRRRDWTEERGGERRGVEREGKGKEGEDELTEIKCHWFAEQWSVRTPSASVNPGPKTKTVVCTHQPEVHTQASQTNGGTSLCSHGSDLCYTSAQ